MTRFRDARAEDVPDIVALLSDDILGKTRETADTALYDRAFAAMQAEPQNHVIVGEDGSGRVVATYQMTFISGLSLGATKRAQVESVRVASNRRGAGLGGHMIADMRRRAREAGCGLLQLTMNTTRCDAHRFYVSHGFVASHTGFKLTL